MLTQRQKEVLKIIIHIHDKTKEPVGSITLLEESGLEVSSATIRNDMATLEDKGLITKTHHSSGRIPSYEGYRYYTDYLIESDPKFDILHEKDRRVLEDLFANKSYTPQRISQLTSNIMSSLTEHPVFVFGQDRNVHTIDDFRFFSLDDGQAIGILITDTNQVIQEVFKIPELLNRDSLFEIAELLTNELKGLSLDDAFQRMKSTLPFSIQRLTGYQLDFSKLIETAIYQLKGHSYYVSGKSYMFDIMPDDSLNPEMLKVIFNLIEGSNDLYQLLEGLSEGIKVIFGREINNSNLIPEENSIITGTYHSGNQKITLGIIGHESMSYHRYIPAMNHMIKELASY